MTIAAQERARREFLINISGALTALSSAGTHIIKTRDVVPSECQALVTAIRDDITAMMSHVETLREVALGK